MLLKTQEVLVTVGSEKRATSVMLSSCVQLLGCKQKEGGQLG